MKAKIFLFLCLALLPLSLSPKSAFAWGGCGNAAIDWGSFGIDINNLGIGFGGGWTPPCVPSCGSCSLPACPTGSNTTSRPNCAAPGTSCSRGTDGCGGACGILTRSCWYLENNPIPTAPTHINYKRGSVTCDIADDIRVPSGSFSAGDGFLARGSINNRQGDTIGVAPLLRYKYRIEGLGLVSEGVYSHDQGGDDRPASPFGSPPPPPMPFASPSHPDDFPSSPVSYVSSGLLGTNVRYTPVLTLQGGQLYDVHASANSVNRCVGSTDSPEICRTFRANHIPQVLTIEMLENPNDGVSGNIDRSGSEHFECEVDNPKTFKVTFEDLDGCADLHSTYGAPTSPVCGGGIASQVSLRAIDPDRAGAEFVRTDAPNPDTLECLPDGKLVAYFTLEFEGEENRNLQIQARANDILNESSGWVNGPEWTYDGQTPQVTELNPHTVLGIRSLQLSWGLTDNIFNLSGVRGVRISSQIRRGEVLTDPEDYGNMEYENTTLLRDSLLSGWTSAWESPLYSNAEIKGNTSLSAQHSVDVGRNQDGEIHFKLEAVDRACNYVSMDTLTGRIGGEDVSGVTLGAPWIATRGGNIYSGGDIRLAVRNTLYSNILPDGSDTEETTLSTELVSLSGEFKGFDREDNLFYSTPNYSQRLSYPWYDLLLSRANMLDPDQEQWTEIVVEQGSPHNFDQVDLEASCRDGRFVYFISGDLEVLPENTDFYKDLGSEDNANGCIFVVKGDINIGPGRYQSETVDPSVLGYKPVYDIIRGYFVSDGVIDIQYTDSEEEIRDGLKIIGGLFATGGEKSVKLGRSFQLRDNLLFPSLIVFHDARYLDIAREVLGGSLGGNYLRDLGLEKL